MKIHIWLGNNYIDTQCCVCGEPHEQGIAVASLIDGEDQLGYVCPDCLEAGHLVAAERATVYAERLRRGAQSKDALAPRLAAMSPDEWETVDRLSQAEQETSRFFQTSDEAERKQIDARWPQPRAISRRYHRAEAEETEG
jgi:hypothetical protein